jgi:parvulin-like peptidyl-prolyl isomerase
MLQRHLKYFLIVLACFLCTPAVAVDDAILAVVNSDVITVKDMQDYLKSMYSQLKVEGRSDSQVEEVMSEYKSKGIQQLIDDKLILEAANKLGIILRPKAVDDRLSEIKARYPSNKDFIDMITREGITITEIRQKIEDQFKGQVIINKEVREKISVNPQEVTTYFNAHPQEFTQVPRVFLESIYVKSLYGKDEARKKIDQARASIRSGADFSAVAKQYSELPSIGEVKESDLRPEMQALVSKLTQGDVSDVLAVPDGFYLFKLTGRTPGKAPELKDVKEEIYQKLFEEKFRARFKTWVDELRKKAYVELKA